MTVTAELESISPILGPSNHRDPNLDMTVTAELDLISPILGPFNHRDPNLDTTVTEYNGRTAVQIRVPMIKRA